MVLRPAYLVGRLIRPTNLVLLTHLRWAGCGGCRSTGTAATCGPQNWYLPESDNKERGQHRRRQGPAGRKVCPEMR